MTYKKYCQQTGKVCYSLKQAEITVAFFKKARKKHGKIGKNIPTRIYFCKFCGEYHLTHFRNKRNNFFGYPKY